MIHHDLINQHLRVTREKLHMLKTYRIIPFAFILCLFVQIQKAESSPDTQNNLAANIDSKIAQCQKTGSGKTKKGLRKKKNCFADVAEKLKGLMMHEAAMAYIRQREAQADCRGAPARATPHASQSAHMAQEVMGAPKIQGCEVFPYVKGSDVPNFCFAVVFTGSEALREALQSKADPGLYCEH
jgi:hypothetical protein